MKKSLLCLLLMFTLVLPMLVSCQQEADITETEAEIYTFYMIVGDSTTPEAVHEVELALNRTIFYRLGSIVKLVAVTEDEYNDVVDDMIAQTEAYQLEKKNSGKKSNAVSADESLESGEAESSEAESSEAESSEAESSSAESEGSEVVKTGDYWLDVLTAGGEIEIDHPQIDIFVALGYERYYNLAFDGKLSALDEKLNNEAKALKSSIHSTLLTAAKVNKKTYGVPVNTAIGEYTYLVFDKELLDKYGVDPNTIKTMADLNEYASTIKENEPDVIPIKGSFPSADIDFLIEDGFPAIVTGAGYVEQAYNYQPVKNYLAMIARYQTLGYFENSEGKTGDEARSAVRIETTGLSALKQKYSEDKYEYTLYSNPIATNENTIDNTICVSSTVNSSNLTKVIQIVTAIYTDSDLMDLLTYGVKDVNYILDDKGQVERLNNDYMAKAEHIGNCFITNTLSGEDPNKWRTAIQQNQDARVSKTLGYTSTPTSFTYTDEDGAEQTVNEPDYNEIISSVVNEYYPRLMQGNAIEINYERLLQKARDAKKAEYTNKITGLYKNNILKPMIQNLAKEETIRTRGNDLMAAAEAVAHQDVRRTAERELTRLLKAQFEKDNPDATAAEINDMIRETLTDEYIEQNLFIKDSEEKYREMIEVSYNKMINDESSAAANSVINAEDNIRKTFSDTSKDNYKLAQELKARAEESVRDSILPEVTEKLTENLTAEYKEDHPNATEAEINAYISEALTGEYINDNIYTVIPESEVTEMIDEEYNKLLDVEVANQLNVAAATNPLLRTYLNELQRILNSEEYKKDLESLLNYDAPAKVEQEFDTRISNEISLYTAKMISEMDEKIGAAVTEFVDEYKDKLGLTENELLNKIGYMKEDLASEASEAPETDSDEPAEKKYVAAYDSWFDFVFQSKITGGYYSIFGQPKAG